MAVKTPIERIRIPFHLPWFIFDKTNKQLITSKTIPSDIADSKSIVLSETPVPGLNFNPINVGGGGNRKVSFTLPLVKRNNLVGNVFLLKQFDNLRNQSFGLNLSKIFERAHQFTPNPKVIFNWGIGSIPLEWYVAKCDFIHKSYFVNALGMPQYSEISMELWLDETAVIYKAEESFRKVASLIGMAEGIFDQVQSARGLTSF